MFCDKARKEVTRARKKCRVNTSRTEASASLYFLSALVTFLRSLSQNKARFWLSYLFYIIALLTFVKKLALFCKKTSLIHSFQARARNGFSACQRAQNGVTGYSVHTSSDKARCFNQSGRALYRNFIIR